MVPGQGRQGWGLQGYREGCRSHCIGVTGIEGIRGVRNVIISGVSEVLGILRTSVALGRLNDV